MSESENNILKTFGKGKQKILKKGGRAVIYQRVSSKEQESGFSPEMQVKMCKQWAEKNEYQVVKCFDGEHESAKTDSNRKRFNEMLKFVKCKKNGIDAVIVYAINRFSRTGTESFAIIDELKKIGITVFSASSTYDARTADGEMIQGFELVQARHDNAVKSKAVIDSGAMALRSGRWISRAPRGYDMKTTRASQTITINAEGELIRKAFKMRADENLTNEEVRERLKAMGLDLSKQRWSEIFRNIFYAGYFAHPFLNGDVIEGRHEPLVSIEDFMEINESNLKTHSRGYEAKMDKEYAPLLGAIRCPNCGHSLTASLSTKMRKEYGKEVGYYVCSRKGCKCNASTKKVNNAFEEWLNSISFSEAHMTLLGAQLKKAFPILNARSQEEVSAIKTNLTKKEKEIEQIEYNLATAPNEKIRETCSKMLAKVEAEKDEILHKLEDNDKALLNLNDYVEYGLSLKGNMLKIWQIASLSHKRQLQNFIFPDGLVWSKEMDDIEPISKNGFLFVFNLDSMGYKDRESGQTADFSNLSALAPQVGLEPTTP